MSQSLVSEVMRDGKDARYGVSLCTFILKGVLGEYENATAIFATSEQVSVIVILEEAS